MIKSIDGRFLSNNIDPQGPFKECPTNGLIIRSVFVGEKPKNTHKFFHIQTYHPPTKKKPVIYQHNNYFVTYLQKIYIEEMEDEDVSEDNNTSSLPQEQPNNRVME
mmetsp:Transcript_7900/g.10322  ORF Transcript_7900/g.10322 Transcript_7900/m.10322 type:complete len:106 (+) Transcript_7900:151-468(+)